eukprot:552730-Prorocentrum_minimum.AAC.1
MVHPASGPGLLDAVRCAGTFDPTRPEVARAAAAAFSAAERRELRAFLCQARWFGDSTTTTIGSVGSTGGSGGGSKHLGPNEVDDGADDNEASAGAGVGKEDGKREDGKMGSAQIETLKALPIYETHVVRDDEVVFVDLASGARFLSAGGVETSLLAADFLKPSGAREAEVLIGHLGVARVTRAAVLKEHVFGRLDQLDKEVAKRTMLGVLKDLENGGFEEEAPAVRNNNKHA